MRVRIDESGRQSQATGVDAFFRLPVAAVADLAEAHRLGLSDNAVEGLMRRDPDDGASRYATADPVQLVPTGARTLLVHGDADDSVPVEISRRYLAAAEKACDDATLIERTGGDHDEVIDPSSEAWAAVIDWLG